MVLIQSSALGSSASNTYLSLRSFAGLGEGGYLYGFFCIAGIMRFPDLRLR